MCEYNVPGSSFNNCILVYSEIILHVINVLIYFQVEVSVNFQYVIRKDELISLHDTYDLEYKEIMKSSALDALKVCTDRYLISFEI